MLRAAVTLAAVLTVACGEKVDMAPSPKSSIFIPLGNGIRTDIADELLPLGKNLVVENAFLLRDGELAKRFGTVLLGSADISGVGGLANPYQLAVHNHAVLALDLATGTSTPPLQPIFVYSPAQGKWADSSAGTDAIAASGRTGPIVTLRRGLARLGANPTLAAGGNYLFAGCQSISASSTVVLHEVVIDLATGEQILQRSFDTTIAWSPDTVDQVVVADGAHAVFVYRSSAAGQISFSTWTLASLAAGPSVTNVAAGAIKLVGPSIDAILDSVVRVIFANGGSQVGGIDFNPSTLGVTTWVGTDSGATPVGLTQTLGWFQDFGSSGKLAYISCAGGGIGVKVQWDVPNAGGVRQAASTYTINVGATSVKRVTGHTKGSSATGDFTVLYEINTGAERTNSVNIGNRTGGVISGNSVLYLGTSLNSRTWKANGDYFFVGGVLGTFIQNQNSYYVLRARPTNWPAPLATLARWDAGSYLGDNSSLAYVANTASGTFMVGLDVFRDPSPALALRQFRGSDVGTVHHLTQFTLPHTMGPAVSAREIMLVPGGQLGQFDGLNFAEAGFAYYPDLANPTTQTPSNAGGPLHSSVNYYYKYVYRYTDVDGNVWRSRPTSLIKVTMGAGDNRVNHVIQTLRLLGRAGIVIEIYRGAQNVSDFLNRVGTVDNDPNNDTVNFSDQVSDDGAAQQEALYTNGGILPNDTIAGASYVLSAKGRIFLVALDGKQDQVWFSNVIPPGEGPHFSERNVIDLADSHGPITGLAAMDDKIIVFKQDSIYAFVGDGPDDLGQGAFSIPEIVVTGAGCDNASSIGVIKDGVFFQSTTAIPSIRLLDRGLTLANDSDGDPIGAAVQQYTDVVTAVVSDPDFLQLRFYTENGRTLVYDTTSGLWVTFTGQNAIHAVMWNSGDPNGGNVVRVTGASVYEEDTLGPSYDDAGQYAVKIASPWVQLSGVRGFERVRELQGVGKSVDDHTLLLQLFADFNDTIPVDSKTFNIVALSQPLWDWDWVPRVQRYSAIKLVMTITSTGAGALVHGFTMYSGRKAGLTRQPESKRL